MIRVEAPLLSVNEPEAQVTDVCVKPGQQVRPGDLLCVLATTKASFDVHAEAGGFVHRVLIARGEQVTAGAVIFEIGPEPPVDGAGAATTDEEELVPEGLRITQPALRLAREMGIRLADLPRDELITESRLKLPTEGPAVEPAIDASSVVILGAGGHAKMLIDALRSQSSLRLVGLVADPAPAFADVLGAPVLGGSEKLAELYEKGLRLAINGIGGIGRPALRQEKFAELAKLGFGFPAVVHARAIVEPSARVEAGAQIFAGAVVGTAARVGFGAIVNTGAIVSHDCEIGDFAHLTPGVVLAGEVKVETGALVGMGVTTAVGVRIGAWARIGNAARVHGDVPARGIVAAGATWPAER
ncbi:MAG: NeuD/PglB/VioB family sugar acetyltransferase [Bryobacteraceae bacterium]